MSKRKAGAGLTNLERFAGTIFFVLYLLLLPLAAKPLLEFVGGLLNQRLTGNLGSAIYYYSLFAVTVAIFHHLLAAATRRFLDNPGLALKTAGIGVVAHYGLCELASRLIGLASHREGNLNDAAISTHIGGAPHMTLLIVVLLAPVVEETLFRGLVFGGLKERSRFFAYAVSCLLFALLHVWQFAVAGRDLGYFLLMLQYLIPGLVLAWAYDHSGTLWSSILLHAAVNALSLAFV